MSDLRKIIHEIKLTFQDNSTSIIYVATEDMSRLPNLIESNRPIYEFDVVTKTSKTMERWNLLQKIMPFNWSEEKYEKALEVCEIVDTMSEDVLKRHNPLEDMDLDPENLPVIDDSFINEKLRNMGL